jgi:hypothetical protein
LFWEKQLKKSPGANACQPRPTLILFFLQISHTMRRPSNFIFFLKKKETNDVLSTNPVFD